MCVNTIYFLNKLYVCAFRPEDKKSLMEEDKMSMSSSTLRSNKSDDAKSMDRSYTQNTPTTQKDSSPSIASVSSSSSSQTSKSVESKDSFTSSESVSFSVDVPSPAPSESSEPMMPPVETNQTQTVIEESKLSSSKTTLEQTTEVDEKIKTTETISTSTQEKITEELAADIDNALAEVVSGLQMLEMQQQSDKKRMSGPNMKPKPSPKHTPDLVLDLPEGSNSSPTGDGSEPDSPTSTADTFAKSNQGTLKKANSMPRSLPSERFYGHHSGGQDVLLETSFMSQQPMLSSFHVKSPQTRSKIVTEPRPSSDQMTTSVTSISSSAVPVPPVELPPSLSQSAHMPHTATPPPVAEKPKLPPKVKPPVMKKPSPAEHPRKFSLPSSMNPNEQKPI